MFFRTFEEVQNNQSGQKAEQWKGSFYVPKRFIKGKGKTRMRNLLGHLRIETGRG